VAGADTRYGRWADRSPLECRRTALVAPPAPSQLTPVPSGITAQNQFIRGIAMTGIKG